MITEQVQEVINRLIQMETTSAYLYLAMSAYFHRMSMVGIERWDQWQYEDRLRNARRQITYLGDRDGVVEMRAVPAQPTNFGSPLEAFQHLLAHEEAVTEAYQKAYKVAFDEGDYQSVALFDWFLKRQTEVVSLVRVIVGRVHLAGRDPAGLLLIDHELSHRHWSRIRQVQERGSRKRGGAALGILP